MLQVVIAVFFFKIKNIIYRQLAYSLKFAHLQSKNWHDKLLLILISAAAVQIVTSHFGFSFSFSGVQFGLDIF